MENTNFFETENFAELMQPLKEFLALPDENFNDANIGACIQSLQNAINTTEMQKEISSLVDAFKMNRESEESANAFIDYISGQLEDAKAKMTTENKYKQMVIDEAFNMIQSVFKNAVDMYILELHNYNCVVKFKKTHPNAQLPTYAHDDDAGADVYAVEDVTIKARTFGNKVNIGLAADIPDGWSLDLRPRSGMSTKTPLRISNCVPTIDTGYKGNIQIPFDNFSDFDVQIHAGDRIAQMLVKPVYRFKAVETDDVGVSARGANGFGSTGA